jgi:HSP20 family protein
VCDDGGMRAPIQTVVLPYEASEFADEVRQVFLELGRTFGTDALAGECVPPLDAIETDDTIEIAVDLPGVAPHAVRLLLKGDALLVIGEKAERRARGESSFHLVERGFGRFARLIRLWRPCDATQASATLVHGELRVRFPKLADRRGQAIEIPIDKSAASR